MAAGPPIAAAASGSGRVVEDGVQLGFGKHGLRSAVLTAPTVEILVANVHGCTRELIAVELAEEPV